MPKIDTIAQQSPGLYETLALTDALRVGRARERELATHELRERGRVPSALVL